MSDIIIRRFKESDLEQEYDLIHKSLNTKNLVKTYDNAILDIWHSYYNKKYILSCDKLKHFYVAILDDKVVGSGAISLEDNMGYLSLIYVDPTIQGKGIGRKIIEALENDDIALQTKKLFMHAALSANLFYQKLGYHYKDNDPEILVDCGLDMVYLEKELD